MFAEPWKSDVILSPKQRAPNKNREVRREYKSRLGKTKDERNPKKRRVSSIVICQKANLTKPGNGPSRLFENC